MSKVVPLAPKLPLGLADLTFGCPVAMSIDDGERLPGVINGKSVMGVIFRDDAGDDWDIDEQDVEDGTIKFFLLDASQ